MALVCGYGYDHERVEVFRDRDGVGRSFHECLPRLRFSSVAGAMRYIANTYATAPDPFARSGTTFTQKLAAYIDYTPTGFIPKILG